MSGVSVALEVVQGVTTLMTALNRAGIAFDELAKRVALANAEGRAFDASDVRAMRDSAAEKLVALREWIEAQEAAIENDQIVNQEAIYMADSILLTAEPAPHLTAEPEVTASMGHGRANMPSPTDGPSIEIISEGEADAIDELPPNLREHMRRAGQVIGESVNDE